MRKLWVLVAILFLTACIQLPHAQGPALSCEQVVELKKWIGMVVLPEQLRELIHEEYNLPLARVEIRIVDKAIEDGIAYIMSWTDKCKLKYMAYLSDREIVKLRIWETSTSGGQLLACLGQPTHYYAYASWEENGPHHRVYLFFPAQGIMAAGSDHWRADNATQPIPLIDDQFPFDDLMIVMPQPMEQIVNIGWGKSGSGVLAGSKPWPGAWEKIEFAYRSSLEQ
jgi:hypothetical protein